MFGHTFQIPDARETFNGQRGLILYRLMYSYIVKQNYVCADIVYSIWAEQANYARTCVKINETANLSDTDYKI